jgi:hypothetical protein
MDLYEIQYCRWTIRGRPFDLRRVAGCYIPAYIALFIDRRGKDFQPSPCTGEWAKFEAGIVI